MPANAPTKLNALTALRFCAAAAVVVMHCGGKFGLPADMTAGKRVPLFLGVSFFFVLSGFILHHVYPALPSAADRRRFLRARFARVWPAHAVVLVLCLAVARYTPADLVRHDELGPWAASLAMLQAWVPLTAYNVTWNVPAWSISTEFGFYLLFPLLVWRFDRTWHGKLLLCLLLAAGLIAVCQLGELPYQAAAGPTANGLLYMNPLARVFEFGLGMAAARLWARLRPRVTAGPARGTVLEVAALALVAVNGYLVPDVVAAVERAGLRPEAALWFCHGSVCLSFAVLIVVAALERGWVTRLLTRPSFVVLGEISYAVYLLHWPLLGYLHLHPRVFERLPGWAVGLGFAVVLLAAAHLMWAFVETPARRFIVGRWPKGAADRPARRWAIRLPRPSRAGLVLGVEVVAVGLLVYAFERRPYRVIPEAAAMALRERSLPGGRDVRFGDRFVLRGAVCTHTRRGLRVDLVWESCRPQPLDATVVVALADAGDRAMGGAVYAQDSRRRDVGAGTIWVESSLIPPERVVYARHHGMNNLAVRLESADALAPDRGPTDPARRTLLVDLR